MNKFLKYFCYPIHLSLILSRPIKDAVIRAHGITLSWLFLLLLITIANSLMGVLFILYFLYSLHLYDGVFYEKENINE
jgi:hypothetical protein